MICDFSDCLIYSILKRKTYIAFTLGFWTILFASTHLAAQANRFNVNVQSYGIEEGLLHRSVGAVIEDDNGIIWIGTRDGLQKFDGHSFKSWSREERGGLFENISNIVLDDEGWLWVYNNYSKQYVFIHSETEEILTVKERFGNKFPKNDQENDITLTSGHKDIDGSLIFHSFGNEPIFYTYDAKSLFEAHKIHDVDYVELSYIDSSGIYWFYADHKYLLSYNRNFELVMKYTIAEEPNKVVISSIYEKDQSYFFTKYYMSIQGVRDRTKPGIQCSINDNGVMDCTHQKFNEFSFDALRYIGDFTWGFHKDKIVIGDIETDDHIATLYNKDIRSSPSIMKCSLMDSRGNVWIGSSFGLTKIRIDDRHFKTLLTSTDQNKISFNTSARGIIVHNDTVIVNLEKSNTTAVSLQHPEDYEVIYKQSWSRPIFQDKNENLILGKSQSNEVQVIDKKGNKRKSYPIKGNTIDYAIWSFYEDSEGVLWAGGNQLMYKNTVSDSFEILFTESDLNNRVTHLERIL